MNRHLLALATGILLLLIVGVGTATAGTDPGQTAGQLAGSGQSAGSTAGTAQQGPTNQNGPIRVLSPGEAGDVAQSNDASSNATAGNVNGTSQTAGQNQSGGSGTQVTGQSAQNDQDALALALTLQKGATNENAPVRVLDDGESKHGNDASAEGRRARARRVRHADQHRVLGCGGRERERDRAVGRAGPGRRRCRKPDRRPGGRLRAGRDGNLRNRPGEPVEHQHSRPGPEPGRRWFRHAVERGHV